MNETESGPLALHAKVESWPLRAPFRISGYVFEALDVLVVTLEKDGHVGVGEAAGVYYRNDKPQKMLQQIASQRDSIERGITRDALQALLPPNGARNALDCALWDLEAKVSGHAAWELAAMAAVPRPLLTTFGCSAASPDSMAAVARGYTHARAIKLKLTGEPEDRERVIAVREARPDVWLSVDANQGFTRPFLENLLPVLIEARVALIEQPFPRDQDRWLDGFDSPIPIAADESAQGLADLQKLVGRFQVVNIKLDKCGGLTEGLAMARSARAMGLRTMVGNMIGTSLAMAPAFLVGQLCEVVDLDGPIFLESDRPVVVDYSGGHITCPEALWGFPQVRGRSALS